MAAFGVCERLAELRYVHHIVPKVDKESRLRGTLIHLAMAYYYASRMPTAPRWYYEKDLHTALVEKGQGLPDGIEQAMAVMQAYDAEYRDHPPPWTPVTIESEFVATLREIDPLDADIDAAKRAGGDARVAYLEGLQAYDDEYVSCRPDILVDIPTEAGHELWVVDYKSQGPAYRGLRTWYQDAEYLLDWQVLVNLTVVRAPSNQARLGHRFVKGFMIQRMTNEPVKGRFFFDRHILTIPKLAYARTPRRMRLAVAREKEVRQKVASGIETTQSYWACYGRYGACDYRSLCAEDTSAKAYQVLADSFRREV
jgi:hypothetical protein